MERSWEALYKSWVPLLKDRPCGGEMAPFVKVNMKGWESKNKSRWKKWIYGKVWKGVYFTDTGPLCPVNLYRCLHVAASQIMINLFMSPVARYLPSDDMEIHRTWAVCPTWRSSVPFLPPAIVCSLLPFSTSPAVTEENGRISKLTLTVAFQAAWDWFCTVYFSTTSNLSLIILEK